MFKILEKKLSFVQAVFCPRKYYFGVTLFMMLSTESSTAQGNVLKGMVRLPDRLHPKIGRLYTYEDRTPSRVDIRDIHVVLYPLSFDATWSPQPNAVITQKNERFIPQVLMITPGSTVYFLNEDNQYHNVFSRSRQAVFNIGRRPPGHVYPKRINRPGMVRIFCDMHAHMRAYVIGVETPYYTRLYPDGSYYLDGLPDGRYRVEIIHPNLNSLNSEVGIYQSEVIRDWDLRQTN